MKIIQKKLIKLITLLPVLCLLSGSIHALTFSDKVIGGFDQLYESSDTGQDNLSFNNLNIQSAQVNLGAYENKEYHTYIKGFEPAITAMTIFPGLNSIFDKPKQVNCQTSIKSEFQILINNNCVDKVKVF